MNPTLVMAIKERKVLELRYHGYSRTVEPCAYGRKKDGEDILRCYQISGGSESGEHAGWKVLKVHQVFSMHLTEMKFLVRPEYKRNDKSMDYIYEQI